MKRLIPIPVIAVCAWLLAFAFIGARTASPVYALKRGAYIYIPFQVIKSDGTLVTGETGNLTLRWRLDGQSFTPANAPTEPDSTNLKGQYEIVIKDTESTNPINTTGGGVGVLGGVSKTAGSIVVGATIVFESDTPAVNVTQVGGATTPVTNIGAAFDGSTGYGFPKCTMPTVTTLTNLLSVISLDGNKLAQPPSTPTGWPATWTVPYANNATIPANVTQWLTKAVKGTVDGYPDVTLAAAQSLYAPAKAGDTMAVGNVTVGGYAANQGPLYLLTGGAKAIAVDASGYVTFNNTSIATVTDLTNWTPLTGGLVDLKIKSITWTTVPVADVTKWNGGALPTIGTSTLTLADITSDGKKIDATGAALTAIPFPAFLLAKDYTAPDNTRPANFADLAIAKTIGTVTFGNTIPSFLLAKDYVLAPTEKQFWEYGTRTLTADPGTLSYKGFWEYATRTLSAADNITSDGKTISQTYLAVLDKFSFNKAGVLYSAQSYILDQALTESVAGYLAKAFIKQYDVATPVFTAESKNLTVTPYSGTPPTTKEFWEYDISSITADKLAGTQLNAAAKGSAVDLSGIPKAIWEYTTRTPSDAGAGLTAIPIPAFLLAKDYTAPDNSRPTNWAKFAIDTDGKVTYNNTVPSFLLAKDYVVPPTVNQIGAYLDASSNLKNCDALISGIGVEAATDWTLAQRTTILTTLSNIQKIVQGGR